MSLHYLYLEYSEVFQVTLLRLDNAANVPRVSEIAITFNVSWYKSILINDKNTPLTHDSTTSGFSLWFIKYNA